ncbi:AAA family ATPase [Nonomuraea wenchangensis]
MTDEPKYDSDRLDISNNTVFGDLVGKQLNYIINYTSLIGRDGQLRPPWPGDRPPYPGLASFSRDDSEIFFGRDRTTAELAQCLAERLAGGGMLMVSGPSGVGKSSLLRAGLLEHLATGQIPNYPQTSQWPCRIITPTGRPVQSLAFALGELTGRDPVAIGAKLLDEPGEARHVFREAFLNQVAKNGRTDGALHDGRVVLIVDQFEEIFTHATTDSDHQRDAFLSALQAASAQHEHGGETPSATVLLCLSGDFWNQCGELPQLREACQSRSFSVPAMTEPELVQAIVGPAVRAGLEIEEGLVELAMTDLRSYLRAPRGKEPGVNDDRPALQTGSLVALAQAMHATWRSREGDRLTRRAYLEGGGVTEAIKANADRAYRNLLESQKPVADKILIHLTVREPDQRYFRRVVPRRDLHEALKPTTSADVDAVIDVFVQHRLVVTDQGNIALVHESLIPSWPHLDGLLEAYRETHLAFLQLRSDAEKWKASSQDTAFLYQGSRLAALTAARPDRGEIPLLAPNPLQREFLDAGLRQERRRARTRRLITITLALFLVALGGTSAGALIINRAAAEQRDFAAALGLVAQSTAIGENDPSLSRLLAAVALKLAPNSPDAEAAGKIAATLDGVGQITSHNLMTAVAATPDGTTVAAAGAGGFVQLWDLQTNRQKGVSLDHKGRIVLALAFDATGQSLVSVDIDGLVRTWRTSDATLLKTSKTAVTAWPPTPGTSTTDLRIRPLNSNTTVSGDNMVIDIGPDRPFYLVSVDATLLLAKYPRKPARIWSMRAGDLVEPRTLNDSEMITAAAFSHDGSMLATGTPEGVSLWSTASGQPMEKSFEALKESPDALAFDLRGERLAVAVGEKKLSLFTLSSGEEQEIGDDVGYVSALSFSPDGRSLAAGSWGGTCVLWDLTSLESGQRYLVGHTSLINAITFTPDGRRAISASKDGSARIWNVSQHAPVGGIATGENVTAMAMSRDTSTIALGQGSRIELHRMPSRDARASSPLAVLRADTGENASEIVSLAFSRDDRLVAATDGSTITAWNISEPTPKRAFSTRLPSAPDLTVSASPVGRLAFSPDGKALAVIMGDSIVRFLNTASGRIDRSFDTGLQGPLTDVAFAPDSSFIAIAGNTGAVQLWNLRDESKPITLAGHVGDITALTFSPDGRLLATAGSDSFVRLWNVAAGKPQNTPPMRGGRTILAMTMTSDGATMAAASSDGTISMWDTATGRAITEFTDLAEGKQMLTFSHDSTRLIGASGGAPLVRMWNLDFLHGDTRDRICHQAGRALTADEWHTYLPDRPYQDVCVRE